MSGASGSAMTARRTPLTSNAMDLVKVQSSQGRLPLRLLVGRSPDHGTASQHARVSRSTAVPLLSEALRENRGQTGRSLPRAEHTSGCHPYIRADLCRNAIGNRQPCHRSSPLTGVPRLGYRSLGDLDRVINLEAKIANPT